jgi:hypothetical protein
MTLEGGGGGGGVLGSVGKVVGSVVKPVRDAVTKVVQTAYEPVKQLPFVGKAIDNALVSVDKSVGKAIPGGWGTVAAVASSFIPGSQLALMGMTSQGLATGLGALSGSGVLKPKGEFNLQGAIMGGALAYGASEISQGLQNAGDATSKSIEAAAKAPVEGGTSALTGTSSAPVSGASTLTPTANALQNIPTDFVPPINPSTQAFTPSGDYGLRNLTPNPVVPSGEFGFNPVASAPSSLSASAPTGVLDKLASGTGDAISGAGSNMATAGKGLANLAGFGADGTAAAARSAFTNAITTPGLVGLTMGGAGLAAFEEEQKYLDQQKAAGNISQAAYDTAKAKIDAQVAAARANVAANPLQTSADTSNLTEGPSLYGKKSTGFDTLYDKEPTGGSTLYEQTPVSAASGGMINYYAMGGNVQENPPDDQTGMMNHSPMTNFNQPGIMSMVDRTVPQQTFAAGGMPRFLSGGGDGMSDSIKANINGTQEARLADGEFVVPADVVSHLGNGSSKAGAKQLYSMMDKVRQARVGTKKQGKQINPRKYLAA